MVVAGSTCTAWSRMGKKRKWSAFSAIVFMIWAVSTLSARPDFILHECTEDFDVATLELVFSALYLITSFVFSPRDLGIPASRPRRYSILVLRARFEPTVQYALEGFGNMFFRRLQCNGHAYWTAPVALVDAMVQTMASKKGLPSTQPDGSQWPIREVMSSSKHTKLLGYERLCGKTRRRLQYIVNIHQTSSHCHGLSDIAPCLMTATSTVWSMTHNRMLIPLEHLCARHSRLHPISGSEVRCGAHGIGRHNASGSRHFALSRKRNASFCRRLSSHFHARVCALRVGSHRRHPTIALRDIGLQCRRERR